VTAGAPSLDGHVLAERYEALREAAVGSGRRCDGVCGLTLLMRKGMAAWMTSIVEERVRNAAIPAASSAIRRFDGIEQTLVDIVASMALATALEDVT
jgi:hypothetical protein